MKNEAILLLSILVCMGCRQVGENQNADKNSSSYVESGFEVTDHLKEIYHRFPSPEEMFAIIEIDKTDFNSQFVNSTDKINQYLDSRSQAINLGVYTADLAYVSALQQHTESIKYFDVIYELSNKLRISSAFDKPLMLRIQENINNADSLKVISELAFNSLYNFLESTDNEKVFALISMGGFVEAMYLSLNFVNEYDENSKVIQHIADQKYVLNNILSFSKQFEGDIAVAGAVEEMKKIQEVYNNLSQVKTETSITRDSKGKLVVSGGSKLIMSENEFSKLKEAIYITRKRITQN